MKAQPFVRRYLDTLAGLLPELDAQSDDMRFFVLTGPQFAERCGDKLWAKLKSLESVTWLDCGADAVKSVIGRWKFYRNC